MSQDEFFIIFSVSRCGSTALHRALNSHDAIECLFEPTFDQAEPSLGSVLDQLDRLRASYSGIKHVWDPSGFPFRSDHRSRISDMEQNAERWLRLNETLLSRGGHRTVFLRRRNALARAVSDLLGQQTNVWGPGWQGGVAAHEGAIYRRRLEGMPLRSIDLDLIDWYLKLLPPMEDRLRRAAETNACFDLDYEDLVGSPDPLAVYRRILDFLGYPTMARNFDASQIARLLGAGGKLNTSDVLRRIPNLAEIERRFGTIDG